MRKVYLSYARVYIKPFYKLDNNNKIVQHDRLCTVHKTLASDIYTWYGIHFTFFCSAVNWMQTMPEHIEYIKNNKLTVDIYNLRNLGKCRFWAWTIHKVNGRFHCCKNETSIEHQRRCIIVQLRGKYATDSYIHSFDYVIPSVWVLPYFLHIIFTSCLFK